MILTAEIAGLPLTSWLLLLASFGIGLIIELTFYFRNRHVKKAQFSENQNADDLKQD